jgi:site-specific recombinase XerD
MMKSERYRNTLMQLASQYSAQTRSKSISDLLAITNEFEKRIADRIFADDVFVREISVQDWSDDERGIRLTGQAVNELLAAPGLNTLRGIRDTALLALMVCTGIREHEAVALDVADLRVYLQGVLCLRVRDGKGAKQRLIPYGTLAWCLEYADLWMQNTRIADGALFRGFWGESQSLRNTRITVRQINRILNRYPILINGTTACVKPHDLRRTYARLQFESGMQAEALQQNMGHASYDTTLGYIGTLDAAKRMSKVDLKPPKLP